MTNKTNGTKSTGCTVGFDADGNPVWQIDGWTFDPVHQEWYKRVGPSSWLVSKEPPR